VYADTVWLGGAEVHRSEDDRTWKLFADEQRLGHRRHTPGVSTDVQRLRTTGLSA